MATILPHVSDITGLDNYMLNGQSKFDKSTGTLLNSFLSHLPSPVCLVAHNGDAFDFPLLKAEMEKVSTPLDPMLLCADSYNGIRSINKKRAEENHSVIGQKFREIYHWHFVPAELLINLVLENLGP